MRTHGRMDGRSGDMRKNDSRSGDGKKKDGAGALFIGIRVDSNEIVGGGHLNRCLTVAEALADRQTTPIFFTTGAETIRQIEASGFQAIRLSGRFDAPENELDEWGGRIKEMNLPLILADSYYFTADYLRSLRGLAAVAVFDDLQKMLYPCDLVINYLLDPPVDWYAGYDGTGTTLLLGSRYIPLRGAYGRLPDRIVKPHCRRALIMTGAADPCGVAEQLANAMLEAEERDALPQELAVDFVFGRFSAPGAAARRLAVERTAINLLQEPVDLPERIRSADLVATAAATMLFEAAACGTPAVVYTVADNQTANARVFSRLCGVPLAGDFRGDGGGVTARKVLTEMWTLAEDEARRRELSRQMKGLVDGAGAERIADALIGLAIKKGF